MKICEKCGRGYAMGFPTEGDICPWCEGTNLTARIKKFLKERKLK